MTRAKCLEPLPADAAEAAARAALLRSLAEAQPPKIPPIETLLTGVWKVALGLNPAFDTFDCQVHHFTPTPEAAGSPATVKATFSYRIQRWDGTFFTRVGGKIIDQPDRAKPYLLRLRLDPDYMHYEDMHGAIPAPLNRRSLAHQPRPFGPSSQVVCARGGLGSRRSVVRTEVRPTWRALPRGGAHWRGCPGTAGTLGETPRGQATGARTSTPAPERSRAVNLCLMSPGHSRAPICASMT